MKAKVRTITSWALIALLVAAALAIAVPRALGGTTLTVLTGSMQPAIRPGDVVAVVPADPAGLREGDVITFQPHSGDPLLVTHRIVTVKGAPGELAFITRGDANSANDPEIIADQIQGRVIYVIPYVGWVNSLAGPAAPILVIAAATALIVAGAYAALRPARMRPFEEVKG